MRGFSLDEATALRVLSDEWNPRCSPPWAQWELKRKVKEATAKGRKPWGYLLDLDRARPVGVCSVRPSFTDVTRPPAEAWERDAGFTACHRQARDVLERRGLDPESIDQRDLARVLDDAIVLPVYDAHGVMTSLHRLGDEPTLGGLYADGCGVALLAAGVPVEGMPQPLRVLMMNDAWSYLAAATSFSDADDSSPYILGRSASWPALVGSRIPDGAIIYVEGDARVGADIRASAGGGCRVFVTGAKREAA